MKVLILTNIIISRIKNFSNKDINIAVENSLDSLSDKNLSNYESVIIKPNLCYYWDYSTGQTTDPRVVSAVVDWIRKRSTKYVEIFVAEADASAMKTKYVFKMLGFEKLAKEKQINLVNLSEGEIINKKVMVDGEKFTLPVNKILLDKNLMINVPTLKIHRTIGFTCALKNMFGAIAKPRKYDYHNKLAKIIVAINKIIKSDIILVDGIIAVGKNPKKMGVIITGDDALSTDLFIAKIIGYRPSRSSYLNLGVKEKIGESKIFNINSNPLDIEYIKKEFPKANYLIEERKMSFFLSMLKLYTKIVGDVIPPVLDVE